MDDEDEFDTEESGTDESALVKDLRKQLRAANKKVAELEDKFSEQAKGLRERTVKDVLTAKGVRPGVAKFIPDDVTDEAGVLAWLDENAEDLGIQIAGEDSGSDDEPNPELEDARRVQALSQRGTSPVASEAQLKKLNEATTPEEFDAAFRAATQAQL